MKTLNYYARYDVIYYGGLCILVDIDREIAWTADTMQNIGSGKICL